MSALKPLSLAIAVAAGCLTLWAINPDPVGSQTATEGVIRITVSPQPFYQDIPRMTVKITTRGPAPANRYYLVSYESATPLSVMKRENCAGFSRILPLTSFQGGTGTTTTKYLPYDTDLVGADHWCAGAGIVDVVSIVRGATTGRLTHVLARIPLRIYRTP